MFAATGATLKQQRAVIVGAGIGGLSTALVLARHGLRVDVLEKAGGAGGKLRQARLGRCALDAGPTVLTMRWVFEQLFDAAGAVFSNTVSTRPMQVLARHAWDTGGTLDLHASVERSADAIGDFAGAHDARGYLEFSRRARQIYQALEGSFILRDKPSLPGLVGHHLPHGWRGARDLLGIAPFEILHDALGRYFQDPRLRQLFGRYATYCGSSPYAAPATLMLVAHVEQCGVWDVEGGMAALATAMETLAIAQGVQFHYGATAGEFVAAGNRITAVRYRVDGCDASLPADAVFCNSDTNAVGSGRFGADALRAVEATPVANRSLSALTWNVVARCGGFPMHRHNVFFSADYAREFSDIFRHHRLPAAPTVYVCAQDRGDSSVSPADAERLLVLVNAPATGDIHSFSQSEVQQCQRTVMSLLARCGLQMDWANADLAVTTPNDWNRMFPATGGALYGRASHGWRASFQRPGVRTRIANLYLMGGSCHPGPGVAMAALSGQQAARAFMADHRLTSPFRPAAMHGGMSTR